jgi:hypothetical protein
VHISKSMLNDSFLQLYMSILILQAQCTNDTRTHSQSCKMQLQASAVSAVDATQLVTKMVYIAYVTQCSQREIYIYMYVVIAVR